MHLRFATPEDAGALLEIYRPYVEHTVVSFEEEAPSIETFRDRITSILKMYPYLLCEMNGTIAGYAYASRHGERAAYRWSADLSVYLAPAYHGRGIGKAMYRALIGILELQQIRTVYGAVVSPNPASEGLHESLGFHRLGVFRKVGYKHGKWLDVIWFEKAILPYDGAPGEPVPVESLGEAAFAAIMVKMR